MGPCIYPSDRTTFSVGPFLPPLKAHARWPLVPDLTKSLLHASAGSPLRYVVNLIYPARSERSFGFLSTCPSYVEKIVKHGRVITEAQYELNCDGLGPIRGQSRTRFNMVIHIPWGMHGKAVLVWGLDLPNGYSVRIPVKIT